MPGPPRCFHASKQLRVVGQPPPSVPSLYDPRIPFSVCAAVICAGVSALRPSSPRVGTVESDCNQKILGELECARRGMVECRTLCRTRVLVQLAPSSCATCL